MHLSECWLAFVASPNLFSAQASPRGERDEVLSVMSRLSFTDLPAGSESQSRGCNHKLLSSSSAASLIKARELSMTGCESLCLTPDSWKNSSNGYGKMVSASTSTDPW